MHRGRRRRHRWLENKCERKVPGPAGIAGLESLPTDLLVVYKCTVRTIQITNLVNLIITNQRIRHLRMSARHGRINHSDLTLSQPTTRNHWLLRADLDFRRLPRWERETKLRHCVVLRPWQSKTEFVTYFTKTSDFKGFAIRIVGCRAQRRAPALQPIAASLQQEPIDQNTTRRPVQSTHQHQKQRRQTHLKPKSLPLGLSSSHGLARLPLEVAGWLGRCYDVSGSPARSWQECRVSASGYYELTNTG